MSLNCVIYINNCTFYIVLSKEFGSFQLRIYLGFGVYLTDAVICSTVRYGALFITVILLAGVLIRILLHSTFVRLSPSHVLSRLMMCLPSFVFWELKTCLNASPVRILSLFILKVFFATIKSCTLFSVTCRAVHATAFFRICFEAVFLSTCQTGVTYFWFFL